MNKSSRLQKYFDQLRVRIKQVYSKALVAFPRLKALGWILGVIVLFILMIELNTIWYSGRGFWSAIHEPVANLNFNWADYQAEWKSYSDQQDENLLPTPDQSSQDPLPEINERGILADFSKDHLRLDLTLSMSKDSEFAKSMVDGLYIFSDNDEFLQTCFGQITVGGQDMRFQYDSVSWEINEQAGEFIVHLQQDFPYQE